MKDARWDPEGSLVTVTLDRPDRKNPLSFDSYAGLRDRFRALKDDPIAKVVVLTGAGSNFCSGGDVREIIGPLTTMDSAELHEFTQMTGDLVKAMRACPQPIVAAIDGVCVGAGAILAMACDLRLGTPRSKVAFLFTRVGLGGCDMGACAMLPRIIGHGRAAELLYTGRSVSGDEAFSWGFYNALFDPEKLHPAAIRLAESIAGGPTIAHAATKRMMHAEWDMPLDEAIDAEAKAQAELMLTKDFKRAYDAFIAGEKPVFAGD